MEFQTPAPSPSAPAKDMSLPQRIWGILVSPRAVLESVRERPRLLGAVLVLAVLYLAAGILLTGPSTNDQLDQLSRGGGSMSAEELEAAQARVASISRFAVPASAVTFGLAAVFVAAGVLMLLANVALGGNCTFKAMAAATALTSMVGIPASLVRIPLSMAKGTTQVATSLAAVLPPDAQETLLYRVLNQLDVFGLWGLALNILAVSIVGRVPMRGAAIGVIALWLVWVVLVVLVQSLFAGLGGA